MKPVNYGTQIVDTMLQGREGLGVQGFQRKGEGLCKWWRSDRRPKSLWLVLPEKGPSCHWPASSRSLSDQLIERENEVFFLRFITAFCWIINGHMEVTPLEVCCVKSRHCGLDKWFFLLQQQSDQTIVLCSLAALLINITQSLNPQFCSQSKFHNIAQSLLDA